MAQAQKHERKSESNNSSVPIRPSGRLIFALTLVLAVGAVGFGVQYLPNLNWIVERESSLRNQIDKAPVMSWFLGLCLYFSLSLIPGTAGKSVVFGWLYGFIASAFIVEIGLTSAALLTFLVGRYFVRQILHRRWQIRLQMISQRFDRDGAFYLLWLRLAHAPFTLVNYGAGATKIPLVTFWWTTHLGILPGTLVFTFLGSRIPNIRAVVDQGVWAILDPALLIILAVTAIFPVVFSPWLRRNSNPK